jgi:hypothetical protein
MYDFTVELQGWFYGDVLEASLDYADAVGLFVQERPRIYRSTAAIVEGLNPFFIEQRQVDKWPGTTTLRSKADVLYLFTYCEPIVEIFLGLTQSIYDWLQPDRPEDLHLLRADGSPWLASIAHEKKAWLELRDGELAELRERYPDIASRLALDRSDGMPAQAE